LQPGHCAEGQVEEAIASVRKAIELAPKEAVIHVNLGAILCDAKRDYDRAVACFRTAIELDPKNAFDRATLGNSLKGKGQLDEAIASFRKAIELAPDFTPYRTELARAERLAAARDRLADFQNGSYTPASNEERLELVDWCQIKKLYHTATGLYADELAEGWRVGSSTDSISHPSTEQRAQAELRAGNHGNGAS
jgi:Tfp pilus assembly protein PilF